MGRDYGEQGEVAMPSSVRFHHLFSIWFSIFFVAFPAPIVISFFCGG